VWGSPPSISEPGTSGGGGGNGGNGGDAGVRQRPSGGIRELSLGIIWHFWLVVWNMNG